MQKIESFQIDEGILLISRTLVKRKTILTGNVLSRARYNKYLILFVFLLFPWFAAKDAIDFAETMFLQQGFFRRHDSVSCRIDFLTKQSRSDDTLLTVYFNLRTGNAAHPLRSRRDDTLPYN